MGDEADYRIEKMQQGIHSSGYAKNNQERAMNKPEKEMLLAVLEKRVSQNGKEFYVGFMGLNTVYVKVSGDKMYINLQKWPKKDNPLDNQSVEDDVSF